MPFDGLLTKALIEELKEEIIGSKVRKIYQPENDEIRLILNKSGENINLLISANSSNSRVHLFKEAKLNPASPPSFCMILRKHLINCEVINVSQLDSDRVIIISFRGYTDLGEIIEKRLICEITGHNSNIILTKVENGTEIIIDSIKKVGSLKSQFRHILPGIPYKAPPKGDKLSLFNFNDCDLKTRVITSKDTIEKFFIKNFLGVSPKLVREICFRNNINSNELINTLSDNLIDQLIEDFHKLKYLSPSFLEFHLKGELLDYYILDLKHLGSNITNFQSLSELLEDYYHLRDKRLYFRNKSQNLRHQIETIRKRKAKKIQNLDRDLNKSKDNNKNKLYADLITANIWQLEKGLKEAELTDYTKEPPETVKVPLKINETPSQNAQRFYKKYSKNKRAQVELQAQLDKTLEELDYIDSLLNALEVSSEVDDLNEILYEFSNSNLIKKRIKSKDKYNLKPAKPLHFISSEGFDIYVGKNNIQNDYISTKLGKDEDCWLHVKDAPGSHVLIVANDRFITEQTVLEGGMLAAYYSSQKQSENIPVDYMEFKFVKKPKNAKPGQVIFTDHNTMFVTPDIEHIKNLKQE